MSNGRLASEWAQTSQVLSLLYANWRIQLKNPPKALGPADFNPFVVKAKPPIVPLSALKALLPKKKRKQSQ